MGQGLIIKFDGSKCLKSKCRFLNHSWYEKNVDCFKIRGRWCRKDSGEIFFDYSTQQWERFSQVDYTEGFVEKNKKGFFTKTPLTVSCVNEDYTTDLALNHEVAIENGYIDSLFDDKYYAILPNNKIGCDKVNWGAVKYQAASSLDSSIISYNKYSSGKVPFNLKRLDKLIKGYKFGFEIESNNGFIKTHDLLKHGFIGLKDGSLRNRDGNFCSFEYTSIPLEGSKGIKSLIDFCDILKTRCTHDIKCSVHIHISGYDVSKQNTVVLYKLISLIQDDMLSILPYYKTEPGELKNYNYCAKLPNIIKDIPRCNKEDFHDLIDDRFISIFNYMTDGFSPDYKNNLKAGKYPRDRNKWDINTRKKIVNFVSYMFSKPHTVEFRALQNTFNEYKIVYWLLICIAILKYANNEGVKILEKKSLTLEEILKVYYKGSYGGSVYNTLVSYIKERRDYFSKCKENGDYIGIEDVENDFTYKPEYDTILNR